MKHIFLGRVIVGGVVVQKILLVMVSCIVVCGFAYRWGDAKWEDAKITAIEHLYASISEVMFPQIHVYEYDKKTLMYQDMEQVFMPVVSSFRSSGTRTSNGLGTDAVGQEGNEDQVSDNMGIEENQQQIENPEQNIENQQNNTENLEQNMDNQPNNNPENSIENISNEQMEEVSAQPGSATLQKKTEINRTKLQDFDYLRQNFYQVDNTTTIGSDQLDVAKLLGKDMSLSEYGEGARILIYHTHSQEGYADSVKGDANTSVVALGAELARVLQEKYGIQVLHHTGTYDVPDHAKAYGNALPNIEQILRENPAIEVVIDLHRDGVPSTTRLVTEINGKPTAQIMFFNGLSRTTSQGDLAYLPNSYIEDNLAFSFQMQLAAAEYYPGFTRRIYLKGYRYNMHVAPKSMLVEVGAQTNTFAEAKNAMEPLADLLAIVLTGNE